MLIGLCFQLISSGTKCDHRQRRASQKLQLNDTISSNVNWKVQKVKKSVQSLLSPLSLNAPFVTFITGPMCSRESARPRTRLAGDRGRTPAGRTRCLVSPLPWHDIGDWGGVGGQEAASVCLIGLVLGLSVLKQCYERLPCSLAL